MKRNAKSMKNEGVKVIRAITRKYVECSGGSKAEVDLCPITGGPLYPWKKGPDRATA